MSTFVVNGQPIDLPEGKLTAGDLKQYLGSTASHSVIVTLTDGSDHQLQDHELIPVNITEIFIIPTFRYGLDSDIPQQNIETHRRLSRLEVEKVLIVNKYNVEVTYDSVAGTWFHIARLPLPPGWNNPTADILIDIPHGTPGYPQVAPEWFWTNWNLATGNGHAIGHFFKMGQHGGDQQHWNKGWGHFCMHLNAWKPIIGPSIELGDNLLKYLYIILKIFSHPEALTR